MRNLQYFIKEELFYQNKKMSKNDKLISDSVIEYMKRKLDFNPKHISVRKKFSDATIGDVVLSDNTLKKDKFTVHFNPDSSYIMILKALIHELTHVKQIHKKELRPDKDWQNLLWKDNYELSIRDYKKAGRDFKVYSNLPWEKEAYGNANKMLDDFLKSKEWNSLKGKDETLDFIIDNI